MNNLKLYNIYKNYVISEMIKKFNYKSIMQVPYIHKITLNIGIGKFFSDSKIIEKLLYQLSIISAQKPIITKSKKSISNFKIRKGYPLGCKVTLRKFNMWSFIERLIYIVIPRIRDFRGLSLKSFDKFGNYSFGIKELIIFPEINFENNQFSKGMDISISIKSSSKNESIEFLKLLNFPF